MEQLTTSQKISFLSDPYIYEEPTESVEVRETHMSLLFLTDCFVYKLKKPVKINTVNFTTLEDRLQNSREELGLNQLLAPGVYLGLVPLVMNSEGFLELNGQGNVVDWLVKMKRLQDKQLLDQIILSNRINSERLNEVAEMLAAFYFSQEAIFFSVSAYQERLRERIRGNHEQLADPVLRISRHMLNGLLEKQLRFIESNVKGFEERIGSGRIIEAHGDLKPEHISLGFPPVIIDRLEFDKDLRVQDMAEDLSLLYIECELLGKKEVGRVFITTVERVFKTCIPKDLLNFYRSKQASLRAKFAIWHLKEDQYKGDPKWRERANQCLSLAQRYAGLLE